MIEADTAQEMPPDEEELPVGTSLLRDQFTITAPLSAGGFGITYRAMDNVLGRTVVLKECFPSDICMRDGRNVVPRNSAQSKNYRAIVDLFMWEARSLAKLRHPNIVGVHRAFEENETAYMVLDLIEGRDLLDTLEAEAAPMPPRQMKAVLLQLLDAIEKVHAVDLLHRDISPDNILLEKNGTPVLIDFGAARLDASRRTRLVPSFLVAKDGYSPQEFYVAGSKQTPSSDLYALGATFYHLLTMDAPVNSQVRMIEVSANKPDPCPPLTGRIKGYAPAFLQAIDKAMRLHPSERLQSTAEWRELIVDADVGDASAPAPAVLASPPDISQDVDRVLTRLVAETNIEVIKSLQGAAETDAPVTAPQVTQTPRVEEDDAEEVEDPEAALDFGQADAEEESGEDASWEDETREDETWEDETWEDAPNTDDDQEVSYAPAGYSIVEPARSATNWLDRANERDVHGRVHGQGFFADQRNGGQHWQAELEDFEDEEEIEIPAHVLAQRRYWDPLARFLSVTIIVGFISFACAIWVSFAVILNS